MNYLQRTKICPKCGRDLPIDEFPWRWFKTFGRTYRDCYCKECRRKMARAHYWKYHDEVLAKARARRKELKKKGENHGKKGRMDRRTGE